MPYSKVTQLYTYLYIAAVIQSLSCVLLFAAPWTATHQASLSFTISLSLLKLMSIELVMVFNDLIFCRHLLLASLTVVQMPPSHPFLPRLSLLSFSLWSHPLFQHPLCIQDLGSVQLSHSVVSDSATPMDCSTPGFPVHHQLPQLAQTHVYWVGDAIQPSHLLSSPSPPAFSLSQHPGLFQWVSALHQVAKVLELQLQ